MRFKTRSVKGHGRGKGLGFPTVNMIVPENVPLKLAQGVHAARAVIHGERYNGALYYGPVPTFGESDVALEIYLFDTSNFYLGEDEDVEIEVVKFIRPVMTFGLPELLVVQMEKDEAAIRKILKIDYQL